MVTSSSRAGALGFLFGNLGCLGFLLCAALVVVSLSPGGVVPGAEAGGVQSRSL